jgi:hypothetical protein
MNAKGYSHQILVHANALKFFQAIDFGSVGELAGHNQWKVDLDGHKWAVGTSRTIRFGPNAPTVVETMVAREFAPLRMGYSYIMPNDENIYNVAGYRADVTVFACSEDENSCFCRWSGTWDSAGANISGLPKAILGIIKKGEQAAAIQSKL